MKSTTIAQPTIPLRWWPSARSDLQRAVSDDPAGATGSDRLYLEMRAHDSRTRGSSFACTRSTTRLIVRNTIAASSVIPMITG